MSDWNEVLGKLVVQRLRDEPLEFVEGILEGEWKAPSLSQLQKDAGELGENQRELVRRCVAAAVEAGLHSFLYGLRCSIEDDEIAVTVQGQDISELEDDLEGYLYEEDGWFARFSKFGPIVDSD